MCMDVSYWLQGHWSQLNISANMPLKRKSTIWWLHWWTSVWFKTGASYYGYTSQGRESIVESIIYPWTVSNYLWNGFQTVGGTYWLTICSVGNLDQSMENMTVYTFKLKKRKSWIRAEYFVRLPLTSFMFNKETRKNVYSHTEVIKWNPNNKPKKKMAVRECLTD